MYNFLKNEYNRYWQLVDRDSGYFYAPIILYSIFGAALYYEIVLSCHVNYMQFLFLSVLCGPGGWLGGIYFTLAKMF